jgi:hypothetical protein
MEYYKNYNHNVTGMLVLDQNGFDRPAVGDIYPTRISENEKEKIVQV